MGLEGLDLVIIVSIVVAKDVIIPIIWLNLAEREAISDSAGPAVSCWPGEECWPPEDPCCCNCFWLLVFPDMTVD